MQVEILSQKDGIVRILVNKNVIAFYDVNVSGKTFNGKRFVDAEKQLIGFHVFDVDEEGFVEGMIQNVGDDVVVDLY